VTLTSSFNHPIKKVWDFIKDAIMSNRIMGEYRGEVTFLKGDNSYEAGNILAFKWKNMIHCTLYVENVINEDDFKQITYKCIRSEPMNLKYKMKWSFHSNTIDSNTLFIWDILYFNNIPTPEEIENANVMRRGMLKKFDDYFNSTFEEINQVETSVLNIKRSVLWALISNWANFKKLVPFIADEVIYEGDPNKLGTNLTLKWVKKEVECNLKVIKVSCDKKSDIWEYYMHCYKGVPVVPDQEIRFKIVKLSESQCFLEFRHVFKQYIKQDILDTIGADKKRILATLNEKLEKIAKNSI